MADGDNSGTLEVPPRTIRVPRHLSAEAQAFLARPSLAPDSHPPLEDKQAWREMIARQDAALLQAFAANLGDTGCRIADMQEGEAMGFDIVPPGVASGDRRVFLDIHGGALIMCAGEVAKIMSIEAAMRVQARTVSVDYRMPPDHPFPAGLDDCLAFYRALLRDHEPSQIIVGGASAGANLAAATVLRARDEGLPMPAAVVLLSPEADLTESGDTHQTNAGIDRMGTLMPANLLYADGHDLTDPYVSPLFGDFTKGYPPTLLTTGTRDLFLSNTVRFHRALRAANVRADLHLLEAAPHGAFWGTSPEEAELDRDIRRFCDEHWAKS